MGENMRVLKKNMKLFGTTFLTTIFAYTYVILKITAKTADSYPRCWGKFSLKKDETFRIAGKAECLIGSYWRLGENLRQN